jgi:hypothetical protein
VPVVGIDFSTIDNKERKAIITHTARPDPEGFEAQLKEIKRLCKQRSKMA